MILYLDTSALVKLYAREPGSVEVSEAVAGSDMVATSLVAYVEARSAFARKHRLGEIDDSTLRRHKSEFERDWVRLHRLPIDATTVRRAGGLAEQYGLRGYDALHLATADLVQAATRSVVSFACFDDALNRAAARLGMKLLAGV